MSIMSFPRIIQPSQGYMPVSCQCDCACGDERRLYVRNSNVRISTSITQSPHLLWSSHSELRFIPLTASDDFVIAFVPSGQKIVLINTPVRKALVEMQKPSPLSEWRKQCQRRWGNSFGDWIVNVLLSLGFLTDGSEILVKDDPISLIAWIHVTNTCNLRCHYCYLHKTHEAMSHEVGRATIEMIIRSAVAHDFRSVKLKYAGGEPTLNLSLVLEMHSYALDLANTYGVEIDGVVLTNGTCLTEKTVKLMSSHNLRIMVSLDGLGDVNDRQRVFADDRGSFVSIADGIELATVSGLPPDISITVTGRTIGGLPDLITWVLDRELSFSLNFFREHNSLPPYFDLRIQEECIIAGLREVFAVIEKRLPSRSLLGSLIDRADLSRPHIRPCGVGQNYLVIDHHGRVAKCQMHIGHAITTVQAKDALPLIRSDRTGVQNPSVDEKEGCHECSWRYWCAGGCPLIVYRATGRYDVKSPNCNIYRTLFPEIIRLEGLRLLEYANK